MNRLVVLVLAATLSTCAMRTEGQHLCGQFATAPSLDPVTADASFRLTVSFGFSGCATTGTCTVTVDGGVITLESSGVICPTGCAPGGVVPSVECRVPPLKPGSYEVAPFGRRLEVTADGGGFGC